MRLYRRENGVWYIEFGRHKHRSLKTCDQKEAQKLFKEIKRQELLDKVIVLDIASSVNISAWAKEYVKHRDDLDPDTLRADCVALRALSDAIGDIQLRSIDVVKVEKFKSIGLARGLKPVSINTYLRHIKAALNVAAEKNLMPRLQFKMVKAPDHLPRVLSKDEIGLILQRADSKLRPLIVFALYTACRREEVISLMWQNIKDGVAKITGKGNKHRFVKLVPAALAAIGKRQDVGLVFFGWSKDGLSKAFKRLALSCGLNDVHFHTLRHTSATQMLESGIPLEVVQKILGHDDIRTTQIYARISDEKSFKEIEKLKF